MTGLRKKFVSSYLSRFGKNRNLLDNFYKFDYTMENGELFEVGVELKKFGYEFDNQLHKGGYMPPWKLGVFESKYVNLYIVTLESRSRFGMEEVKNIRSLISKYNRYIGYNTINVTRSCENLIICSMETPPYVLLDFLEELEENTGKKPKI